MKDIKVLGWDQHLHLFFLKQKVDKIPQCKRFLKSKRFVFEWTAQCLIFLSFCGIAWSKQPCGNVSTKNHGKTHSSLPHWCQYGLFQNILVSTVLIHHYIGGQAWRFVFMSNAICTVQRLLKSVQKSQTRSSRGSFIVCKRQFT